jgi:hypothetical protein
LKVPAAIEVHPDEQRRPSFTDVPQQKVDAIEPSENHQKPSNINPVSTAN